jgi:hypothetical protein
MGKNHKNKINILSRATTLSHGRTYRWVHDGAIKTYGEHFFLKNVES